MGTARPALCSPCSFLLAGPCPAPRLQALRRPARGEGRCGATHPQPEGRAHSLMERTSRKGGRGWQRSDDWRGRLRMGHPGTREPGKHQVPASHSCCFSAGPRLSPHQGGRKIHPGPAALRTPGQAPLLSPLCPGGTQGTYSPGSSSPTAPEADPWVHSRGAQTEPAPLPAGESRLQQMLITGDNHF